MKKSLAAKIKFFPWHCVTLIQKAHKKKLRRRVFKKIKEARKCKARKCIEIKTQKMFEKTKKKSRVRKS